ncbi:MAG: hypothetical protein ABII98_02640 [bacterium]
MNPLLVETPFGFSLDLSFWADIFSRPADEAVSAIFAIVGWAIVVAILFSMGATFWAMYRGNKYASNWKWVLLAVDIPPLFIQTPKAVEQIFAHLTGAAITPNIGQKYWMGKRRKFFSFEIISIEGYIQFLIRTEIEFRDLVEASVYAQYPEAEITEVEDYVVNIPTAYPNKEYDMFGVEFKLEQQEAYPIRTYPSFEYSLSKDVVFSDPMAAILENFSRIGHGENFWFQIIVEPIGSSWKKSGIDLVKKIIANKPENKNASIIQFLGGIPDWLWKELLSAWHGSWETVEKKAEAPPGKMVDLSPGMKSTVEAIEDKISKVGYRTKIRALYSAKKEVYNPARCMDGFVGSMSQFHILSRNSIVPHKATLAHYAFKTMFQNWKKTTFTSVFKKRKIKPGATPYVLNIEELATIWHFPLPFVKTPLVQKAAVKRAEPPMGLPVETTESPLKKVGVTVVEEKAEEPPPPEEILYG